MKILVTLELDVDVDDWQAEYHHNSTAEAMEDVLDRLREPELYLTPMWRDFTKIGAIKATVKL